MANIYPFMGLDGVFQGIYDTGCVSNIAETKKTSTDQIITEMLIKVWYRAVARFFWCISYQIKYCKFLTLIGNKTFLCLFVTHVRTRLLYR